MGSQVAQTSKAFSELLVGTFDEEQLTTCATKAREELGGDADLALVFISPEFAPQLKEVIEIIQIHARCPKVVGCSAGGLVGAGQEEEKLLGISLLFLKMPTASLLVQSMGKSEEDSSDSTSWNEVKNFAENGCSGFLMLSNPSYMSEAWIQKWNHHVGKIPTYGGLASGAIKAEDLFIFNEDGMLDFASIVIGFRGGVQFKGFVSQGCRPIGEPFTITKAEKNFVYQLASKKAFDQLQTTFNCLPDEIRDQAQGNILAGLAVNEYIEEFNTGDFLVRSILGGDPKSGMLAIGAFPRVGQTLQFQLRDRETAKEDLNAKLAQAKWTMNQAPFAALSFSCGARGEEFFGEKHYDAQAISCYFGPVPMAGFFCSGEVGSVMGETFLHGFSASVILLYEA